MSYNILFIILLFFNTPLMAEDNNGAKIFSERCVLCHGNNGMGEGLIPMTLDSYPSANLLNNKKTNSKSEIFNIISNGSDESIYMPPWKDELSKADITALTDFVLQLRNNTEQAIAQLSAIDNNQEKKVSTGKKLFDTRCALCHGAAGQGDGRMSKVINNPPPFNLTKSIMPPSYLKAIITNGGDAMGRSKQMPPWGEQLNNSEINALIKYIVSLRR